MTDFIANVLTDKYLRRKVLLGMSSLTFGLGAVLTLCFSGAGSTWERVLLVVAVMIATLVVALLIVDVTGPRWVPHERERTSPSVVIGGVVTGEGKIVPKTLTVTPGRSQNAPPWWKIRPTKDGNRACELCRHLRRVDLRLTRNQDIQVTICGQTMTRISTDGDGPSHPCHQPMDVPDGWNAPGGGALPPTGGAP